MCVRSAHLGVEAIVASPVAAGKACLSDEERELGVALVDLGAGVTNVSVFSCGMLAGLKSLPMGGRDITDDIAAAFGTRRVEAERIKCFYGSAMMSPRDNHDMIELAPIAGGQEGIEAARITRAQLVSVIRQRLEHLIAQVEDALKQLGFSGPFGRQVVLTGGGAELKGIADYAQGVLGRTVRIGRPSLPGEPAAELVLGLRNDEQRHPGVLLTAVLGALPPVRAGLVRLDPHLVGPPRDHVRLPVEPGNPEAVDHVIGAEQDLDAPSHRDMDLVGRDHGVAVRERVAHVPPVLVSRDHDRDVASRVGRPDLVQHHHRVVEDPDQDHRGNRGAGHQHPDDAAPLGTWRVGLREPLADGGVRAPPTVAGEGKPQGNHHEDEDHGADPEEDPPHRLDGSGPGTGGVEHRLRIHGARGAARGGPVLPWRVSGADTAVAGTVPAPHLSRLHSTQRPSQYHHGQDHPPEPAGRGDPVPSRTLAGTQRGARHGGCRPR